MNMLNRYVTSRASQPFFVISSITVLLASASVSSAQSQSTNIKVSSAVARSIVNRLDVTLGGEAWVDGGPLRKNLVVNNPGFERADYRAILRCGAATADGCQVADGATAEPDGFWNGAHYQIMSGGATGAMGTVGLHTSGGDVSLFALDKSLSLSAGDYMSVEVLQPMSGVAGWSSSATGGATITAETADLSPETSGKQALLLTALNRGESVRLSQELDAQPGRSKLQQNGAYEVSFRAKGVGGNNQLNVNVTREASGNAPYLNQVVSLTDSWAQYTLSFSAAETGTQSSPLRLSFAAAGGSIELDDVSLQQTNSDSAKSTVFRDEVVNSLQELHPGTIRMASSGSDVLTQLSSPFARYSNVTSASATAYGIQEFLELCATVGADPWITVPTSTTPREMAALVQYLTGDGSDTWSAFRIARGQAEPWTSVFGKVHIELENSTGVGGSASEPMASFAYASWSNAVFGAARSTTGYSAGKFDLILSGSVAIPPLLPAPASSLAAETSITPSLTNSGQVINCSSGFASSGACGVALVGSGGRAFQIANSPTGAMSGSMVNLIPSGSGHFGSGLIYQTPVNVQAFSTTFTFVPNGWNIAFVLQNNTNSQAADGGSFGFAAGAGCEGGFYQMYDPAVPPYPNNIVAVQLDQVQPETQGGTFTSSDTQLYTVGQNPCNGTKISTSPVPLNSPVGTQFTTTGDTYSVTLVYNGSTLAMSLYNVTAGGACPGTTCFTHAWNDVNIPALVGANTAVVGFTSSTNESSNHPLLIKSLVYTVLSSSSVPVPPQISSVSANYGAYYAKISLSGSGFGASQAASTVTFDGVAASVRAWSDTSITVSVPYHATTGNLVVTAGGLSSGGVPFTVEPTPSLTGISPTSGPSGTLVTISGQNLLDAEGKGEVWFGGVSLPILNPSSTSIHVVVPAGSTSGTFDVHINGVGNYTPTFTVK